VAGVTLEQLINDLGRLMNRAEDLNGCEYPNEEARAAALAPVEAEISALVGVADTKVDAVGGYLLKLQRRVTDLKEEAGLLTKRAKTFDSRYSWLRRVVAVAMQSQGFKKLEGTRATMTLLKGSESVSEDNMDLIPPKYLTDTYFIEAPATIREGLHMRLMEVVRDFEMSLTLTTASDKRALKLDLKDNGVPGASIAVGEPTLRVYIAQREGTPVPEEF